MKKVLFFGTFDPLHPGHRHAFFQAKKLGDYLTVVVASDLALEAMKGRPIFLHQEERMAAVKEDPSVNEVMLGDNNPTDYHVLKTLSYDVLAVGYDQTPSDEEIRALLAQHGSLATLVRLAPFQEKRYKSSLLRS